MLFQKILSLFTIILPVLYNYVMAECFFSLICLIKLVMNKDMIFDADGQAAQTELKDQRKGAVRYMIKTYVIDTNVLIQAPYAIKRL